MLLHRAIAATVALSLMACVAPGTILLGGDDDKTEPSPSLSPSPTPTTAPNIEPGCTLRPGPIGLVPTPDTPPPNMSAYTMGSTYGRFCNPGNGLAFTAYMYAALLDEDYEHLCSDVSWVVAPTVASAPDYSCGKAGCTHRFAGVTAAERETDCNYDNPENWFSPRMMAGFLEGMGIGPYDSTQSTGVDSLPTWADLANYLELPSEEWAIESFLWFEGENGEGFPLGLLIRSPDDSSTDPPRGSYEIMIPYAF